MPVVENIAPPPAVFLFHNLTDKFQQLDVELRVQQLDVELMSVVEVVWALSDKVMDSFRLMDLPIAEQVIEVPKVSSSSCPSRAVLREPQMAEQLVEVPTVLSPALLQQVEQIVDSPAPRGRGARGGLPSFLPGQDLQHSVEQIVDTPVPGRGAPSGRQGLHTRQSSSQRTVEQTPDIPVPGRGGHVGVSRNRFQRRLSGAEHVHGALQSSRPGQGSIAFSGTAWTWNSSRFTPSWEDLLEVLTAPSQDRVQQLVVELIIAGSLADSFFILADSRGCGFIESSAEAEFGESASGGFRVPVS